MPYINFMWYPTADSERVVAIVNELRAVADAHNVGFYVNAKEEEEPEPVVVNDGVQVPAGVIEQLRRLATRAGVTIYVHKGD
jgi:hypothetical protein